MGLVLRDRPAEGDAPLEAVLLDARVELVVPLGDERVRQVEGEEASLEVVRPALGDDGQGAAGGAADLRVEPGVDDAELGDGVLRDARLREAEGGVRVVDAVDEDRRLRGVSARADDRSARHESELASLALDARRDERELLELAVRDREVLDLLGDDVRRRVDLVDVHDGRFADDRDRLGDGLGAEDHPELRGLADPERERLLDRLEALEGDLRRVAGRRRDGREARSPLGGGHGCAGEAGLGALQLDRDAGKGGARLVGDVDLHRGVGGLRPGGRGPRQRRQEKGPEEGHGTQEGGSGQPRHLNPPGRQRALSQKGLGPQGENDGTSDLRRPLFRGALPDPVRESRS